LIFGQPISGNDRFYNGYNQGLNKPGHNG